MSYTVVDSVSHGDVAGDYVLEVNVMREQGADTVYWDKQYEYIVHALDEAYYNGYVPNTHARKIDTDADLSCSDTLADGNTWLNNNLDQDGLYLWVVPCNEEPFACCHESGWTGRHQAVIYTWTYPTVEETAIHGIMEALHPFLYNKSCTKVQEEANGEEDHYLGHVMPDSDESYGWNTPMLGAYGKTKAKKGKCDNWNDDREYTNSLTVCTLRSLEYSWNHEAGNH